MKIRTQNGEPFGMLTETASETRFAPATTDPVVEPDRFTCVNVPAGYSMDASVLDRQFIPQDSTFATRSRDWASRPSLPGCSGETVSNTRRKRSLSRKRPSLFFDNLQ
jgi:hypothetical protein